MISIFSRSGSGPDRGTNPERGMDLERGTGVSHMGYELLCATFDYFPGNKWESFLAKLVT